MVRAIQYATFRKDKPAAEGYSAELISNRVEEKYYDNLEGQPTPFEGVETLLDLFEKNVAESPGEPFLGTRIKNPDGTFGAYAWQSYSDV